MGWAGEWVKAALALYRVGTGQENNGGHAFIFSPIHSFILVSLL